MHGRIWKTAACLAVAASFIAGTDSALGQGRWMPANDVSYPVDDAYVPVASAGARRADESADLAERVAELEAALKKINDQEAAAKKKATGHPSVSVGGRIQYDAAFFHQSDGSRAVFGDEQDGVEFRRARIHVLGEAFDVVDYKIEMDFADTDEANQGSRINELIQSTAFKDVYITVKELPLLGHVRVGHFKEPFGLEQLTSSRYPTFIERSINDEGNFVPGRRPGLMAFDDYLNARGTWAVGMFRTETDNGAEPPIARDDDGGWALTTRGTFLPWYDEGSGGRGLLHVGGAYSFRDLDDGTIRFRARPEAHLAHYIVDTANIADAVDYHLFGLETALVYGPLSVQGEYFHTLVNRTAGLDNLDFRGGYVYVSYFLTGEHRPYKKSAGVFDRVRPFENFFRVRTCDGDCATGKGAWEVAYRYSYLDLNDVDVLGGRAGLHTFGVNWYLNPYTRVMWNYVAADFTTSNETADGVNGFPFVGGANTDMGIFEMRAQIDF